jgi:hypothetical protein
VWPFALVFERLFSRRSFHNNRATILITGAVLLFVLLALISFALAISGDQFDDDDLPFFEGGNIPWFAAYLFPGSLLLGFDMGVTITIMRLEYLNSHIGEKRPSDRRVTFATASRLFRTTRSPLGSVVFLISSVHPLGEQSGLRLRSGSSTRSRARNIFIRLGRITRRSIVVRRMNQLSLFKESFQIQGGL